MESEDQGERLRADSAEPTQGAMELAGDEGSPSQVQFTAKGTIPPVDAGGAHKHPHRASASERAFGHSAPHSRSTARAGKVVDVNVDHLVGDSTALNPATETLIRAMAARHLRVGAPAEGLAKLEAVFADPQNAAKLMSLTHVHDAQHLLPWLYGHETAMVPTREHQPENPDGATVTRPAQGVVDTVEAFLDTHPGAKAMIDEAGTRRFELVTHVAHLLAHEHPELRGDWGAYISAAPGGLKTPKVRNTMQALSSGGASVVLEGYETGVNDWDDTGARLDQGKASLALLRKYFAHPGFAIGVDAPRLGLRSTTSKRLHRLFLQRLRAITKKAHVALPGVEIGSWVSRLDGDEHADDVELSTLVHGL